MASVGVGFLSKDDLYHAIGHHAAHCHQNLDPRGYHYVMTGCDKGELRYQPEVVVKLTMALTELEGNYIPGLENVVGWLRDPTLQRTPLPYKERKFFLGELKYWYFNDDDKTYLAPNLTGPETWSEGKTNVYRGIRLAMALDVPDASAPVYCAAAAAWIEKIIAKDRRIAGWMRRTIAQLHKYEVTRVPLRRSANRAARR